MTSEIKRQLIKALVYGKAAEEIKKCVNVTDEDIDSVTAEELETEKVYYREMGYIK